MSVFAIAQLDTSIDADHARTVAVLAAGVGGADEPVPRRPAAEPAARRAGDHDGGAVRFGVRDAVDPRRSSNFREPQRGRTEWRPRSSSSAWPLLELGSRVATRWRRR